MISTLHSPPTGLPNHCLVVSGIHHREDKRGFFQISLFNWLGAICTCQANPPDVALLPIHARARAVNRAKAYLLQPSQAQQSVQCLDTVQIA